MSDEPKVIEAASIPIPFDMEDVPLPIVFVNFYVPSYYYDWSSPGGEVISDDPDVIQKGRMPYGPECRVTLDGEDISHLKVFYIRTGPIGFVLIRPDPDPSEEYRDDDAVMMKGVVAFTYEYGGVVNREPQPDHVVEGNTP